MEAAKQVVKEREPFPFKVRVGKVGNSLKVTLPSLVCEHVGIKRGSWVKITVASKTLLNLELIKKRPPRRKVAS